MTVVEQNAVLITGASGQVGRALIKSLVSKGTQPTALIRKAVPLEGCSIIPDWLFSDRATAKIAHARAIVHLAGTLNPPDGDYEAANVLPARRVADALKTGRAQRLVFLSYVGASEHSANQYLATKAQAERVLRETEVPLTIFRCSHIIGLPADPGPTAAAFVARNKNSVQVLGNGMQRIAPLYLGDVVQAIEASLLSGHDGAYDLQGPDEMTFDDLVRLVNPGSSIKIFHVPAVAARILTYVGLGFPAPLIDVLVHDSLSNHPTAAAVFGVPLTHLSEVWTKAAHKGSGSTTLRAVGKPPL